jgi:hypothetical protein
MLTWTDEKCKQKQLAGASNKSLLRPVYTDGIAPYHTRFLQNLKRYSDRTSLVGEYLDQNKGWSWGPPRLRGNTPGVSQRLPIPTTRQPVPAKPPTHHRRHASQITTALQSSEGLPSTGLPARRALPIPLPAPAAAPGIHPLLPLRHQGSLQPPHPPRSRSQFRQGQDVRKRSQGSEGAWKGAVRLQWWSDARDCGFWRERRGEPVSRRHAHPIERERGEG